MSGKPAADDALVEIRNIVRKLDFPAVTVEAFVQLQKQLAGFADIPVSPEVVKLCNEVIEDFIFFERRRKPLSAIEELQILDMLCTGFQSCPKTTCNNIFFIMFPTMNKRLLDRRMGILFKFISLSITLKVSAVLDCAAYWLHVVGIDAPLSLNIVDRILLEMFDNGVSPCANDDPTTLVKSSPSFCSTLVTVATAIYATSLPPKTFLELLAIWLDTNIDLGYVPLEKIMPTARTFIPGLITWLILADPKTPFETTIVNRLHLSALKLILNAPQAFLDEGHIIKLTSHLRIDDGDHIEKFIQIIQACLTSKCFYGKPTSLTNLLQKLPPTRLTNLIIERNVAYLN